jgi:hypothetical protein
MMQGNQSFYQKSISPDEYVDIAIKNVLTYNAKVAEKEILDIDKVKDMQIYLINQCETTCLGCGFINRTKRKLSFETLNPEEKDLFEAAKKYFASREEIFGVNVERLASRLLEQSIEGEYDSKVGLMFEKLKQKVVNKEIKESDLGLMLANYKFQLMLDAVSSAKSRKADFEM